MARGSFVRPDLRRFPQFLCGPSPSLSLPRTTFAVLGRVTLPPFLDPPPPYHGQVLEAWDPPPVTTDGCWDVCECMTPQYLVSHAGAIRCAEEFPKLC